MWKAAVGVKNAPPVPNNGANNDDDWETDPDFINDVSEQEQRWGSKTVQGSGRSIGAIDMEQMRAEVAKDDAAIKRKQSEAGPQASMGYGGKFGVETDRMDKSAVGHDHIEKLTRHASQTDYASGFGGKYGVQRDRQDKSALGWEHKEKVEKHASQTDYASGFGGKFGVEKDRQDKSALGYDHVEKIEKHESQTGYKVGFGGQYGLQMDRVDQSAVGWEYYEKPSKHSSQTDYSVGFGGKFGVQKDRQDKSALSWHHIEKVEKHESQKDYSKGFGGKFGVQSDRQDKCAVGYDHFERTQMHESQIDHSKGFGGKFGVQNDRLDKNAHTFEEEPERVGSSYERVKPETAGVKASSLKAKFENLAKEKEEEEAKRLAAEKQRRLYEEKAEVEEARRKVAKQRELERAERDREEMERARHRAAAEEEALESARKAREVEERQQSEDKLRRDAEERSRSEQEAIRRREAEEEEKENRRREAEERHRREAEEKERRHREAEELQKRRREAEEQERRRREAEEQEKLRHEAKELEQRRREAEELEKRRRESEEAEKLRREAEEQEKRRRGLEEAERERKREELMRQEEERLREELRRQKEEEEREECARMEARRKEREAAEASERARQAEFSPEDEAPSGLTAIALYDYQAGDEDEISFDPDDEITDIEQISELRRKFRGGKKIVIGIFHPYCDAGGGGERVLWCAIQALQKTYAQCSFRIYTGDKAADEEILARASLRFGVNIKPKPAVRFVRLRMRNFVEATPYPVFTLLGQSLGSMVLGMEALLRCVPDIYLDTMGYAFTYPLFRYLGGCKVGCYTHYPTISSDMISKLDGREVAHNNRKWIAKNRILCELKQGYYVLFARIYGWMGRKADVCMVNSSWTKGHVDQLWWNDVGMRSRAALVHPPCNPERFSQLRRINFDAASDHSQDTCVIVSVAQFRPEKNHSLQLNAFREFLRALNEEPVDKLKAEPKLVLIGGCRDNFDAERVSALEAEAVKLGIRDSVEFKLNVPLEEMEAILKKALIGVHTMWNEHFGISIVELMAAGLIVVAHDSGGPKMDIVVPWEDHPTGFLAVDPSSYAECFMNILKMDTNARQSIIQYARASVHRFSDKKFMERFVVSTEPLFL
ncbi:unnamed protein product [Notodromas monacha]|uniref:GDP-Man:Man(3)GlcNAc(2)-PP-Dol alpha-1,2-mannosyltransferase n=1 Tax=Notodromas monacha TaxID=399045 RepID=A0A7R9GBC9_9CRUS|nr:unnamed protein product [Notodromas monacha]CAG0916366.1 unnamed protein product [Notodromas monacha]